MSHIALRKTSINTALKLGKVTAALLSNRMANNVKNGGSGNVGFNDLAKLWGWVDALISQEELNADGIVNTTTYSTTTDYQVGDYYGGGIIFYKAGLNVLICTVNDLPVFYPWTPITDTTPFIDVAGTEAVMGTGQANTSAIVSAIGAGSYAAKACDDLTEGGYSDWYLPSTDELTAFHYAYPTVNYALERSPGLSAYRWSSTQSLSNYNFATVFAALFNNVTALSKSDTYVYTRPIRSDTVTAPGTTGTTVQTTNTDAIVEEWQNTFTDDTARLVIEKIRRMARKHLPALVYKKILETSLTLN